MTNSYALSCTLHHITLHHALTDCVNLHANYAKIFRLNVLALTSALTWILNQEIAPINLE